MKFKALLVALFFIGISPIIAQPPPPPPPDTPPCWPPPCVPIDNGILFAICAAVLFGGLMIWRSYKLRLTDK